MKAKMNFFTYLLDRGFVLLGWLAFYGLTLLLVWIYPKLSVSWDFAVYLFLLEFFMMSFFFSLGLRPQTPVLPRADYAS